MLIRVTSLIFVWNLSHAVEASEPNWHKDNRIIIWQPFMRSLYCSCSVNANYDRCHDFPIATSNPLDQRDLGDVVVIRPNMICHCLPSLCVARHATRKPNLNLSILVFLQRSLCFTCVLNFDSTIELCAKLN